MRPSLHVVLFVGAVAAQSKATIFNAFHYESTLTQIGADASATTYKHDCAAGNAGVTGLPESIRPKPANPQTTPKAVLARQALVISSLPPDEPGQSYDYTVCEPYTITQGPQTWEFHMTDPLPGAWSASANCKWKGDMLAADFFCTMSWAGYATRMFGGGGSSTLTLPRSDLKTAGVFQAVAVVGGKGAPAVASQTPKASASVSGLPTLGLATSSPSVHGYGSASALASASASEIPVATASRSSGAAAAQSTSLASGGPLPGLVMIFVAGGASILAAALAF